MEYLEVNQLAGSVQIHPSMVRGKVRMVWVWVMEDFQQLSAQVVTAQLCGQLDKLLRRGSIQ